MRVPRRPTFTLPVAAGAATVVALLGATTTVGSAQEGDAAGSARRPSRPQVTLSATPEQLEVIGLPCLPTRLMVGMTNSGDEAVFADTFVTADEPLETSRGVFSSYVPAGTQVTAPVQVTTARDTAPGDYEITLDAGRDELQVPVEVVPVPAPGPGVDLALGEQAFASSTHGSFHVCGAVDGNRNPDDWNSTDRARTTGWNDATSQAFPDSYGVQFPAATTVGRVDVLTLDSARYPAARYGLRDWDVQVQVGGQWQTVAQVRGNVAGTVSSTFPPVTAEAVQVVALASNDGSYSRIVELEVFSG
jgi:hypothetical protein